MAQPAPNFPRYHCPCPSSSTSLQPVATHPSTTHSLHSLDSLYFCDDCDAIRCERCVQVDITSYYCPNCLFEVPNASVRAERNRCARNCFQCPDCSSALHVVASDPPEQLLQPTSIQASMGQPPYFLECRGCQWSSAQIDMSFEKPLGLAHQVLEQEKVSRETVEVDRLQSHFDHYIHRLTQSLERQALLSAPRVKKISGAKTFATKSRYPYGNRGNSPASTGNLPPMRHLGSVAASSAAASRTASDSPLQMGRNNTAQSGQRAILPAPISEDPNQYRAKYRWKDIARNDSNDGRSVGNDGRRRLRADDSLVFDDDETETHAAVSAGGFPLTREAQQVRELRDFEGDIDVMSADQSGFANIEKLWDQPWAAPRSIRAQRPSRMPLLAKRTKRCPTCSHTLIRPESKPHSTRFKIKIAAMNYLPGVEVGARRLVGRLSGDDEISSWHDGLTKAKVLGGRSEKVGADLEPGNIYAFQLALTNPLLDSISVTLRPLHTSLSGAVQEPERYFDVWFPVDKVQVAAFGEAGDEATKKMQDRAVSSQNAEWVDEGESVTKVRFCVLLHDRVRDHLQEGRNLKLGFDLNLELIYTVEEEFMDDAVTVSSVPGLDAPPTKDLEARKVALSQTLQVRKVEKTFSFDMRVDLGVASSSMMV